MQSKLDQLFSTPPDESDKFRSNNLKKITRSSKYLIHSLATLGELLTEMKIGKETPVLRYLVDLNKAAWFARETRDHAPDAPAHFKMTGSPQNSAFCKTAGNLFFSEDYSTLISINHKSGDFRPSFDSIKWILAIIVINEACLPFNLPEVLIIDELDHNGKIIGTHQCLISSIKKWLTTFTENTALTLSLKEQNAETKTVRYGQERLKRFAETDSESAPLDKNRIARNLEFADHASSDKSNMSEQLSSDSPNNVTPFRAFQSSSLSLFAPSRKRLASRFTDQESPDLEFEEKAEETATAYQPPPKKSKLRHLDFVSVLTPPTKSEAKEADTANSLFFKGSF
ncbi:hypothetical protein OQJ19_01535 [Fluoribacter gormanii]|uniref:Uncharacterized protein n=1 Tax=Fluoribacter gormanii TaxID=464 RepID=A0A377GHK3_9GAMM|nr:hypothetical protein [Fluoribacter gormanii]KTD01346.1 hypothetical protein Lgor_2412 [Fluoribacter gormanii]MCW8469343.1 hypothetical protein [Fluoribacter gormanii]SIR93140.1 hypothetical protein SAMN05421777_1495 [Fluoribacter gormanii]STO24277.1 Uncharacterised protein [Fluoribacter gormanii]